MKKMTMTGWILALAMTVVLPVGCSARDPQPELYPNEHLRKVGEAQAKQDIAYCQALSQQYLQQRNAGAEAAGNTVGGAIGGNAGKRAAIGAGVGAALGLLRGLSKGAEPPQNYEAFVRKCMTDKGYDVIGFGR